MLLYETVATGLGVKASRKFLELEIIWIDPAIVLLDEMSDEVAAYAFDADERRTLSPELVGSHLLSFGMSSFVNHSDTPNCDVTFAAELNGPVTCTLHAVRPIEEDEELFISYADIEWYYDNGLIPRP